MEAGVDGTTATINWECTLRGFDSLFRMLGPIYIALTFEIERAANPRYGISRALLIVMCVPELIVCHF